MEPLRVERATSPGNDSERLISHMGLDTPIRLDCRGRPRPGLASRWSRDSAGLVWTFTLREDARRYDGSPMTAEEVVRVWDEWQAVQTSMALQSAVALDERTISITLSRPQDSVPKILADPAFSVAVHPSLRPGGVHFEWQANQDPRDALDRGAGLLVSRDPAVMQYVSSRPEFQSFPLPWSRTYVLVEASGKSDVLARAVRPAAVRESLARDAVRADARPAEPPFWWSDLAGCPPDSAPAPTTPSSRVVYDREDEVARGLAERLVALAGSGSGLRTAGLESGELGAALEASSERGYVLALPTPSLAPCRDAGGWPRSVSIVPLIDTRAHAIVRRGAPPLSVEWDGTVRVDDAADPGGSR